MSSCHDCVCYTCVRFWVEGAEECPWIGCENSKCWTGKPYFSDFRPKSKKEPCEHYLAIESKEESECICSGTIIYNGTIVYCPLCIDGWGCAKCYEEFERRNN